MPTTALALAALLLPLAAHAGDTAAKKKQPQGYGFFGENSSGAAEATGDAGRFIEEAPGLDANGNARAQAAQAQTDARAAAAAADIRAVEAASQPRGRIGGFVMVDPATARRQEQERIHDAVAQPRPPADSARRYGLWGSVAKPLQMTPAKIGESNIEQAAPAAEGEFERRMLGADKTYHARPQPMAPAPAPAAIPSQTGQLFVAVDLALPPQAELKDAVASFSRATGFVADPRFVSAAGTLDASRASLRGWLPTDRLAQAIQAPGVMRIEVDHGGPQPLGAGAARASLVIGLRLPPDGDSAAAFQSVLSDLQRTADLRWTRTIGFQTLPDSRDVALVIVGEVPVTRIPKLLAHPAVLKIAPAPPPSELPQPSKPADSWPGFWTYARRRAPLLLTFTALFLLPQVGEFFMRALRAFVPYGRR